MAAVPSDQIFYLAVGRVTEADSKKEILASITTRSQKNTPEADKLQDHAEKIVEKAFKLVPGKRIRQTSDAEYVVHVESQEVDQTMLIYIAVTVLDFATHHQVGFMFEEWHTMLESTIGAQNINAPKNTLNSKIMSVLNRILENYNTSSQHTAQVKAEQVKDVMRENIDISLQNVEKLDDMDQKSADIEASSRQFHNYTKQVRWKMLMEQWKGWIVVGSIAFALFLVVVIVLCS